MKGYVAVHLKAHVTEQVKDYVAVHLKAHVTVQVKDNVFVQVIYVYTRTI